MAHAGLTCVLRQHPWLRRRQPRHPRFSRSQRRHPRQSPQRLRRPLSRRRSPRHFLPQAEARPGLRLSSGRSLDWRRPRNQSTVQSRQPGRLRTWIGSCASATQRRPRRPRLPPIAAPTPTTIMRTSTSPALAGPTRTAILMAQSQAPLLVVPPANAAPTPGSIRSWTAPTLRLHQESQRLLFHHPQPRHRLPANRLC